MLPFLVFFIPVTGKVSKTLEQGDLQRIDACLGQDSRGCEIQEHDADICLTSGESHLVASWHADGNTYRMACAACMLARVSLPLLVKPPEPSWRPILTASNLNICQKPYFRKLLTQTFWD